MELRKRCLVLYGSETGTSEDVAFKVFQMMRDAHLRCEIASFDDYEVSDLPMEQSVIFVVSTTGEGECPSTMKAFWSFLLKR
jgi:sulfite reductase alpha subunit-like flavoprotein